MDNIRQMPQHRRRKQMTGVKKKTKVQYFDYSLLAVMIFLVCFGLVMLYSTSAYSAMIKHDGDSMYYFKRQVIFCAMGFLEIYVISRIDYHIYSVFAIRIYVMSNFLITLFQTPLRIVIN